MIARAVQWIMASTSTTAQLGPVTRIRRCCRCNGTAKCLWCACVRGVLRALAVFQVILGIATTAKHVAPRLPRGLGQVSHPLLPPLRQLQGPIAVSYCLQSAYPASSSLPILPSSHPPCQLPCPALSLQYPPLSRPNPPACA